MSELSKPGPSIVASTQDFHLEVDVLQFGEGRGITGYRLRNLRTGIVEQEGNIYAFAVRTMHLNQKFLEVVDADPAGEEVSDFEKGMAEGSFGVGGAGGGNLLN